MQFPTGMTATAGANVAGGAQPYDGWRPRCSSKVAVLGAPIAAAVSTRQQSGIMEADGKPSFYPNPDIRVNFGDPVAGQTGRLFLPFDALLGRVLKNGWVASLEGSVPIIKDYPVYDFKVEGRAHFSY